jgi:DNA polymerase-1
MILLLDADMLLYKAMASAEVEVELSTDVWTRHVEMTVARERYWEQITLWVDQLGVSFNDVWHCFTDKSAFRRDLSPTYKHNRKGKPKPIGYAAMRAEIMQEDKAFMFNQIEADDLLGIFATMQMGDATIIVSGDKDLMQIPGKHLWIDQEITEQSYEDAERFTYEQILCGDATDGIPGCPSIGKVNARRIVDSFNINRPLDCWQEVVRTYETKGKIPDASVYATQQAQLVRILRAGEYNFHTHTVKLWTPPAPTLSSASLLTT